MLASFKKRSSPRGLLWTQKKGTPGKRPLIFPKTLITNPDNPSVICFWMYALTFLWLSP
jgi:hypothetical protein